METYWPLVNQLEEAWTGVEERDRAIISKLVTQYDHSYLIMVRLVRYTISKAKRPYRGTFWSFQSHCGQMMILRWPAW